jgi:sporulation integral membrane protein YtvI
MTSGTRSIINTLSALPKLAIFFLISIVATFFIAKDEEKIANAILHQLPLTMRQKFLSLKNNLFSALIGFLKAQLIILTITFIESLIGLNIIGVRYAFLISVFVSIVDILPVLGTGSVYVPWAIISILMGNTKMGISLLILYGIIVPVRYLVEPKIIGHQLGIHPLLTLMSMFVGIKLFGVGGVILGPTIVVIIKAFQNSGILPRFRSY